MICELVCDVFVVEPPEKRIAKNGMEYLKLRCALPNSRGDRGKRVTFLDCTIFHNTGLINIVSSYNLKPQDRLVLTGQFFVEYYRGRTYCKMVVHSLMPLTQMLTVENEITDELSINNEELQFEMYTPESLMEATNE